MMIKKEAFLAVNGYCEEFKYVNEDGCLFTKLIQAGYKFYSIQKPLISVRVDINQRKRRTGLKIFMEDIKYKKFQFDKNFISKFDFLVQLIVYFVFRLTPSILKNYVYRLLRR